MVLYGLKPLYDEMKATGELRQQFIYTFNNITVDVLFLTDDNPFLLVFAKFGNPSSYVEFEVKKGFWVETEWTNAVYIEIANMFSNTVDPKHPLRPYEFWKTFEQNIPSHITHTRRVTPKDMVRIRSDVDENEKIYFCGFTDQSKCGRKARNFDKTLRLMGIKAAERCKKENLSTKWSHDPKKDKFAVWKTLKPDLD